MRKLINLQKVQISEQIQVKKKRQKTKIRHYLT
jgi:hypothetical protein